MKRGRVDVAAPHPRVAHFCPLGDEFSHRSGQLARAVREGNSRLLCAGDYRSTLDQAGNDALGGVAVVARVEALAPGGVAVRVLRDER